MDDQLKKRASPPLKGNWNIINERAIKLFDGSFIYEDKIRFVHSSCGARSFYPSAVNGFFRSLR